MVLLTLGPQFVILLSSLSHRLEYRDVVRDSLSRKCNRTRQLSHAQKSNAILDRAGPYDRQHFKWGIDRLVYDSSPILHIYHDLVEERDKVAKRILGGINHSYYAHRRHDRY